MFSNIRNFCLCFVTLLCTADGDIKNSSSDQSVIITSVNDSAFLLSRPNESKHEYKNKNLDWILKPSTLNIILEHSHPENSEVPPLRKRETMLTNHSVTLTNHSGIFSNGSQFFDHFYTVYFNDNTNASNQSLSRPRKQAGKDYYNKELYILENSNTGDEVKIPTSPVLILRDKTPKAIKEKSRLEITVAPMPILGNDSNKLRESGEVTVTIIETDNESFNSSKVRSEAIEKSKEKTTALEETRYKTEQPDFLPEIFNNKNEFHINTPISLEDTTEEEVGKKINEDTTEEVEKKINKVSDFIPAKSSESLTTNKMVLEESTLKSVILESEKRSNNWFSNFEDITNIHLQNRYENKSVSKDFLSNANGTIFKLDETNTNGTIFKLDETNTNGIIFKLDETNTNGTIFKLDETNTNGTIFKLDETNTNGTIFKLDETNTNGTIFKLDETNTNGTIDELEYETSTNSSIYDLELSVTNDTLYSNRSDTTKSIIITAAVPNIPLMGNQDEDYINNNLDFKLDGSSTSGIDVDRKQSYTSIPTVPTSSKGISKGNYMIRGEKSTTTSFTSISRTPDLPYSEVKIIPVRAREYTVLMAGIILCCVGVVLIIGVLIIFFYRKKKTTSNDVEMVSSVRFDEP